MGVGVGTAEGEAAYTVLCADPQPPLGACTVDGHPHYLYLLPSDSPSRGITRLLPSLSAVLCATLLLLALAGLFFLAPRPLDIASADIDLAAVHFHVNKGDSIIPQLFLNLALDVRMQVSNANYFDVTYESVSITTLYHGDTMSRMESSHGGKLDALSVSSVDATTELNSYHIASNVFSMLEDIANRALPLQTVTEFVGYRNFLGLQLPLEGKVSCSIVIDPQDQVLRTQHCGA